MELDQIAPILSICIATYNRAKYISYTLDSILIQNNHNIEIIIVDGASTDNTAEIIDSYKKLYDNIFYYRLSIKGGVDHDYDKSVEFAKGKYCWLFPDDDLMINGAIKTILSEINNNYSLIVVDAIVKNIDFSKTIVSHRMNLKNDIVIQGNDLDKLFKIAIPHLSFIGAVIIDRNVWMTRERINYFNTEFIHIGVIFQNHLPDNILMIKKPLVIIRFGNAQWTDRAFEIWLFKWCKLLCSFDKVSNQYKIPYLTKPSLRRMRTIIVHRAEGSYTLNSYLRWFKNENLPKWWKVALFLISISPKWLIRLLVKLYLNFNLFLNNIKQIKK